MSLFASSLADLFRPSAFCSFGVPKKFWMSGIRTGALSNPAGALPRLFAATKNERHFDIGLEIAGSASGAWVAGDPAGLWGELYLIRQGASLGGGSSEMSRNIISERVLGMPREYAADRDRPFDEVRHNRSPQKS